MSSNKILNVQIINTHDTESNWKQIENNFVPFDGEIIVYSPDEGHVNSRIKIGNGKATLAQLNFFTGNIIKTKTVPGANNNNTQTIYQVVDNNDEVVSYWYYSNGEWCELGANNVDLSGKADIDHTHTSLDVVNWDNEIISILPNKEGGLSFGVDSIDLSLRDASNTSDRIIWPQHDENDKPVWNLGHEYARFKTAYVDKIVSQAGDGWTTSITPIFNGIGPGYQVDHLTASTLFITGHCNDNNPILMFGQVPIFTWTSPWTESGTDNGMQFNGDIYAENLEVGNIINAQKFVAGWSEIGLDTITTRNILLSDANQEGDNVLIYNYYESDKDIGYVNMEYLYADYEIRTDGYIYEEGEALVDRYARKDEDYVKIKYADLVELRDNAQLKPGAFYRITDYMCTTSKGGTGSAGHQFDIILRADSEDILNENAWAAATQIDVEETTQPKWKEGIQVSDVQMLYKISNSEGAYLIPSPEEGLVISITTTLSNGIEVPAFIDADPDGESGYVNNLLSIQYVVSEDSEILYEEVYKDEDVFVEIGYLENIPVLYKTNPLVSTEADYGDVFKYKGTMTIDGETFDAWDKYEDDEYSGFTMLTQQIIQNNLFTITQEQLTNAISLNYVPSPSDMMYIYAGKYEFDGNVYDSWFESDGIHGRLTNEVVDGDWIVDYFTNYNLSAWKLKYCLDNDLHRFEWADVYNGRGVIYYMQDHNCNECWYDFKNILFEDEYTFGRFYDDSNLGSVGNTIKPYVTTNGAIGLPDNRLGKSCSGNSFGNNCYSNSLGDSCDDNSFGDSCHHNSFDNYCHSNSFGCDCGSNSFGNYCDHNSFGNYCYNNSFNAGCGSNSFDNDCHNNSFGYDCYGNSFGNNCDYNSFGDECTTNSFDNGCFKNSFGYSCGGNSFGNDCRINSFGDECYFNSFGNKCYNNSFDNTCENNSFGNYCYDNSFGDSCKNNSFGNECNDNSFNNNCNSNSFGNGCDDNSFDDSCSSNSFGNVCDSNSFGNNCRRNSFGDGCEDNSFKYQFQYNSFGNNCLYNSFGYACEGNSFGNDCYKNSFGNNCYYNLITHCDFIKLNHGVSKVNCTRCRYIEYTDSKYTGATIIENISGTSSQLKQLSTPDDEQATLVIYRPSTVREVLIEDE